ncbi:MAG: hypothetical protein PHG23_01745 [Candidatus Pacebacteria bacterium]|nr:hypothetical protein [Candidatus Paceibacterota bacterium]
MVEKSQAWLIETTEGESYWLFIDDGYYSYFDSVVKRSTQAVGNRLPKFYAIKSTGVKGSELDILKRITENHEVFFAGVRWKNVEYQGEITRETLADFKIVNKQGDTLFTFKDVRVLVVIPAY